MPKARAVVDAIIDSEADTDELLEKVSDRLSTPIARLNKLSRLLVVLVSEGKISVASAEARFKDAFTLHSLAEYATDVEEMRDIVDAGLERQLKAISELDRPLSKVPAVRRAEIRDRLAARKAARNGTPT